MGKRKLHQVYVLNISVGQPGGSDDVFWAGEVLSFTAGDAVAWAKTRVRDKVVAMGIVDQLPKYIRFQVGVKGSTNNAGRMVGHRMERSDLLRLRCDGPAGLKR